MSYQHVIELLRNTVTPVDYTSYESKTGRTFKLLSDAITVAFNTFHRCYKSRESQKCASTSSIQIGYIPTAWKLATLRMLLKPDKFPSLTASFRRTSLMSSIMKLFERVIEQRLRSCLEDIGFINKYQSGFRQDKSTDDHLFRLSSPLWKALTEENM